MNDPGTVATSDHLRALSTRQWPVIVVGAGLAGASMAFALTSRGVEVLLIDRAVFPRAKTCGGCLNPRTVDSLRRLGLGHVLDALEPNPVAAVEWRTARGRRAQLAFPGVARERACAVSRSSLDVALIRAAIGKGATFLGGVRVVDSCMDGDARMLRVRMAGGEEFRLRAGLVVACDGLGSTLVKGAGLVGKVQTSRAPSKIGTSAILPPDAVHGARDGHILMACGAHGYAGVVRVEGNQWDVAAAIRIDAIGGGIAPFKVAARILEQCGVRIDREFLAKDAWTVTPPHLTRSVTRPWAERLLLVGDAAGYVEPITGEGMAWALAGVEAAVPLVVDGWTADTGARWQSAWNDCVARRTRLVRMVSRIASSPVGLEMVVAALNSLPAAGGWFTSSLFRDPAPLVTSR